MSTKEEQRVVLNRTAPILTEVLEPDYREEIQALRHLLQDYVALTHPTGKLMQGAETNWLNLLGKIQEYIELRRNAGIKSYTTGQLAKIFGVSVTSINKWIEEGRFVGYQREERNRHAQVPETTLWQARDGRLYPVWQIVELKEAYEKKGMPFSVAQSERKLALQQSIKNLEAKYSGTFEETLGKINENERTIEQGRDAEIWQMLLAQRDAE